MQWYSNTETKAKYQSIRYPYTPAIKKPKATNKVDTSINLANDGGSKSNTGYFQSGKKPKGENEEKFDELDISRSSSDIGQNSDEDSIDIVENIKSFTNKIKDFILSLLGLNKPKMDNIYKKGSEKNG